MLLFVFVFFFVFVGAFCFCAFFFIAMLKTQTLDISVLLNAEAFWPLQKQIVWTFRICRHCIYTTLHRRYTRLKRELLQQALYDCYQICIRKIQLWCIELNWIKLGTSFFQLWCGTCSVQTSVHETYMFALCWSSAVFLYMLRVKKNACWFNAKNCPVLRQWTSIWKHLVHLGMKSIKKQSTLKLKV